jgi:LAT3 family solute carrier family 43 protein 3
MGFLFVPAIDYIVEDNGLILSLLFTNGIGVLYNALALIPNLAVQCLTFLVFTCFRAFLYAVMSAFAAKTFGLRNLGTLVGLIFTVSSFISLLEYPAVYISNEFFGGDLSALLMSSLILSLLLFPFTECYRKRESERLVYHQRLLQEFGVTHDYQGLTYLRSPSIASPGIRFPNISKKA